eukprot:TRINITY_DN26473_c0_g1_i2.p1 TRINITY_DN26473_c0_g1~~TRINITY_DN26473_c0_g1_i2.p1  ORF type:complete len:170 (-),score=26.82 TRINITY_DN26473_c0_g1_i2:46-555(-)
MAMTGGYQRLPEGVLRNTAMCSFHMRGQCQRGAHCNFAHDQSSLLKRPDFDKTVLCGRWKRKGKCNKGDACKHAHGPQDLRRLRVGEKANNPSGITPSTSTAASSPAGGLDSGSTPSTSTTASSPRGSLDFLDSPLSEFLTIKNTFIDVRFDKDDGRQRRTRSLSPFKL